MFCFYIILLWFWSMPNDQKEGFIKINLSGHWRHKGGELATHVKGMCKLLVRP